MRQIAQMPEVEHSWLAPMIEKSNDLDELGSKLANWLLEEMYPNKTKDSLSQEEYNVWRMVREIYPALLENEAITSFLNQNPNWMGYLPEVETSSEAAEVAAMDLMYVERPMVNQAAEWLGKLVNGMLKPDVKI